MIDLPADGETTYGDAVMPLGWNCRSAVLEVISPTQKTLLDRKVTPLSVGMWSPGTPEEGIEAGLVVLKDGEAGELEQLEVQGKFILTPGKFSQIRQKAAEQEAAGVITWYSPNPDATQAIQWVGTNTSFPGGWGTRAHETAVRVFSISPQAGKDLAALAADQEVRLQLKMTAELSESTLPLVTGLIPGQTDEEILLFAPLYGPGAHFHAVAVAAALELARVLQDQLQNHVFPKPIRGIRFLFGMKTYGQIAYAFLKKEQVQKTIYALALDGGAGDPDVSWSRWSYRTPPGFLRHYSDGLAWQIFNQYLQEWRPQRFWRAGLFHSMIPCSMIRSGSPTHSLDRWDSGGMPLQFTDTPDTIDRRSCIDLVAASTTMMLSMANVMAADIPDPFWNFSIAQERMNDDIQVYLNQIKETRTISDLNEILTQAAAHFPHRVVSESRILDSLATLDQEIEQKAAWRPVEEPESHPAEPGEAVASAAQASGSPRGAPNISPRNCRWRTAPRDERIPRRKTEVLVQSPRYAASGDVDLRSKPLRKIICPLSSPGGWRTENVLLRRSKTNSPLNCVPTVNASRHGLIFGEKWIHRVVHPQPEAVGTIACEDKPEKSENEATIRTEPDMQFHKMNAIPGWV